MIKSIQRRQLRKLQHQIIVLQTVLLDCHLKADQENQLRSIIEMLAVKCSEIGEQIYENHLEI